MKQFLPTFLKWRYELYVAEYVDLYGSLGFFVKQFFARRKLIKKPKVAYIYANKGNVGDYISFLGIRQLIDVEGLELFCTPVWEKQLAEYIKRIKQRNPECVLMIGGGGLLQPVFESFWQLVLTSKLPFVCMGIGINKMPGRGELSNELLKEIATKAQHIGVRDTYTHNYLTNLSNKPVYLGICPSVNYVNRYYWNNEPSSRSVLLHMYHPSDLRLAGADLQLITEVLKHVSKALNLEYQEHSNMSSDHEKMLATVSQARVVVSSRLHGCIMSFASGTPFLPLYCDEKIKAFNDTHTHVVGVEATVMHDEAAALKNVKRILASFDNQQPLIKQKTAQNADWAEHIKTIIPL
ncbi:MAG: polysaccharide pyruvyl transferase family protein [Paraglaciecola sp.]|nr:polysaccharide pyruvyl transferase family protein [Paraglaciecola sp.]